MKNLILRSGVSVIVDDDVFEEISTYTWRLDGAGYPYRSWLKKGEYGCISLHRQLMGLARGDKREVDHINGNKLDNRIENLRICTRAENQRNVRMIRSNKSGFKGVAKHQKSERWRAQIQVNKKQIFLGIFDTPEEASAAYVEAAMKYFGQFANIGVAA
jgi:hypothetical protein